MLPPAGGLSGAHPAACRALPALCTDCSAKLAAIAARMSASSSSSAAGSAHAVSAHTGGSAANSTLVLPECCRSCGGCWRWGRGAAPGKVGQSLLLSKSAGALSGVLPGVAAPLPLPCSSCATLAGDAFGGLLLLLPLLPVVVVLVPPGPPLLAEGLLAALLAPLPATRLARAAATDARNCCKLSLAASSRVMPVLLKGALLLLALLPVRAGSSGLAGAAGFALSAATACCGGLGVLGAAAAGCLGRAGGAAAGAGPASAGAAGF